MMRLNRDSRFCSFKSVLLAVAGTALALTATTAHAEVICKDYSVFDQTPFLPSDDWDGDFSDVDAFSGQRYYENFSTDDFICSVRIWGVLIDPSGIACDDQPVTFEVTFHQADGPDGTPGDAVCTALVTTVGEDTGFAFQPGGPHATWPLGMYDLDLGFCCPLDEGWVSVQAQTSNDANCWFMWIGSGQGMDGQSYLVNGDGTGEYISMDMSVCLNRGLVPCVGDLDGDGDTDQSDLGILLAAYELNGDGDLDFDGDTDQSDLGILLADYDCMP
jgi:hypothetical protein